MKQGNSTIFGLKVVNSIGSDAIGEVMDNDDAQCVKLFYNKQMLDAPCLKTLSYCVFNQQCFTTNKVNSANRFLV